MGMDGSRFFFIEGDFFIHDKIDRAIDKEPQELTEVFIQSYYLHHQEQK